MKLHMVVWYCVCAAATPASDKWIHHNYSPSGPETPGLAGSVMVQKQQARHVLTDALNIWYKVTSVPAQRACLQSILIQRGGGTGEERQIERESERVERRRWQWAGLQARLSAPSVSWSAAPVLNLVLHEPEPSWSSLDRV